MISRILLCIITNGRSSTEPQDPASECSLPGCWPGARNGRLYGVWSRNEPVSIISALATWRRPTEPRPGCGGWTLETPADGEPAPGTQRRYWPTQHSLHPRMVTIPRSLYLHYINTSPSLYLHYTILLPSYVINMIHNMPFSSQTRCRAVVTTTCIQEICVTYCNRCFLCA